MLGGWKTRLLPVLKETVNLSKNFDLNNPAKPAGGFPKEQSKWLERDWDES